MVLHVLNQRLSEGAIPISALSNAYIDCVAVGCLAVGLLGLVFVLVGMLLGYASWLDRPDNSTDQYDPYVDEWMWRQGQEQEGEHG